MLVVLILALFIFMVLRAMSELELAVVLLLRACTYCERPNSREMWLAHCTALGRFDPLWAHGMVLLALLKLLLC